MNKVLVVILQTSEILVAIIVRNGDKILKKNLWNSDGYQHDISQNHLLLLT